MMQVITPMFLLVIYMSFEKITIYISFYDKQDPKIIKRMPIKSYTTSTIEKL